MVYCIYFIIYGVLCAFLFVVCLHRNKASNKHWLSDVDKLRTVINTAINGIDDSSISVESMQIRDKLKAIQTTATEKEIHKALGKSIINKSFRFLFFFFWIL